MTKSKPPKTETIVMTRRSGSSRYSLGPRDPKPILPGARWAGSKQVCIRYGKSLMWLWRKIHHDPRFPKPVYDGRLQIFNIAELDEYDRQLLSQRTADEPRERPASLRKQKEAKAKAKARAQQQTA
jgi:hypothetical protein